MYHQNTEFNAMLLSGLLAQSPIHHPALTEHDVRETRLLVDQYQLEIEDSKQRIEELLNLSSGSTSADVKADFETLINETINQKETMERLLAEKSALISPVRRLPSELLALVMICHVRENGQSPWALLAVSRSWRYLGLETPRLWSLIHILQRAKQPNYLQPGPRFIGGVLCRDEEMLKTALTRSGAVLLDMVIDCDLSLMPLDFFSKIVLESGPRWRSLVYDVTDAGQQWDIDWAAALFPNLQSTTFLPSRSAGVVTDGLLSAIESTALKLRSMVLESSALETNLRGRKPILQRIKELNLTPSLASFTFPPQTDATWSRFPRLEVLVMREGYNSTFLNRKDHNLANLRIFAANAIHILADYSSLFKSLTHVYLENPTSLGNGLSMEPEIHSIALVSVTHFGLVGNSYRPLHWFHLPSLILLELLGNTMQTNAANEEFDLIWNFETFGKAPSPIALHAEIKVNDAYLLMALRSMDRLKELYLYYDAPQNSASKFMDSLAVKPKRRVVARGEQAIKKWVPPTCPELETLFMIYGRMSNQERVDISQKLQQIQEARLGTAREMKKLCLLLRSEHVYRTDNLGQQYMKEWPF
jgi:hypothetical protein